MFSAICRQLGAALIILGCTSAVAHADARSDAVWTKFRSQYPLHMQVVGLTGASLTGERVMIISEPAPLLPKSSCPAALRAIFGPALRTIDLRRQPIGEDGWCEDIVTTLVYPLTPEGGAQLRDDLTRLSQHLFGTAYKFAPMRLSEGNSLPTGRLTPLNVAPPSPQQAPPDLKVSAAELQAWLLVPGGERTVARYGRGACRQGSARKRVSRRIPVT